MARVRVNVLFMVALSYVAVGGRASAHHSIQAQFDINKTFAVARTTGVRSCHGSSQLSRA